MLKSLDSVSTSCRCAQTEGDHGRQIPDWIYLIFLSVNHWHQGTDWGSPSCVKNASDHHAQAFFSLLSWLSPASKTDPRSLHRRPQTLRQEKSHYISCHTKSLSRCTGESTHQLCCDAGDEASENTSDASSQPPARTKLQFSQVRRIS